MEYAESLLEEYFETSQKLQNFGGPCQNPNLFDELTALEEEICWEFSLPASPKHCQLFQWTQQFASKQSYIEISLETLRREKTKFFYNAKNPSDFWKGFIKDMAA